MLINENDVYTHLNQAHNTTSWLDHRLSTSSANSSVEDVLISHDYITSDHFPISVTVSVDLLFHSIDTSNAGNGPSAPRFNWSAMNETDICNYNQATEEFLGKVSLPVEAILCTDVDCMNTDHKCALSVFYNDIVQAMQNASAATVKTFSPEEYKTVPEIGRAHV